MSLSITYLKYAATAIEFTNSIFKNVHFLLLQEWEHQYKKTDKKTVVTKLRERRKPKNNPNLDKIN